MDPNQVTNRKSFILFIEYLIKGFNENPLTWENKTLPDFLEALSRYADDVQGYYDCVSPGVNADEASWLNFANIIMGATIYE